MTSICKGKYGTYHFGSLVTQMTWHGTCTKYCVRWPRTGPKCHEPRGDPTAVQWFLMTHFYTIAHRLSPHQRSCCLSIREDQRLCCCSIYTVPVKRVVWGESLHMTAVSGWASLHFPTTHPESTLLESEVTLAHGPNSALLMLIHQSGWMQLPVRNSWFSHCLCEFWGRESPIESSTGKENPKWKQM